MIVKGILTELLKAIFSDNNIREAIEHLKTKKNVCDDEGIWLHSLDEYWKWNGCAIVELIKNNAYQPKLVHNKLIITGQGKHRIISMISSVDRLIVRAIHQVLQNELDSCFSNYSYAYREDKGVDAAIEKVSEYIGTGKEYVVEVDIKDFFDNIRQDKLINDVTKFIDDIALVNLLCKYISCDIEYDFEISRKNIGILQGNALSSLLSNIYMIEFDKWAESKGYSFVRFADNINIYIENMQDGYNILDEVIHKLNEMVLPVNETKKGVFNVFARRYLGYEFEKTESSILVKKKKRSNKFVYSHWHKSSLEKVNNDYFIVNDGILTKKDFSLLFENADKKVNIPVEVTDSINIYSDVVLNSTFLKMISQRNINVNIFDEYGRYQGSFYTNKQRNKMKMLVEQVKIYSDDKLRLDYAKKMDIASVHNMRCNLRYYKKQKLPPKLDEGIHYLGDGIVKMNECKTVNELMMEEARCRQKYYQCFNEIITNRDFELTVRTKRPPKDAINAMISLGNTYLYQKIAQMILRSSVDIRISFVHSATKRYESLNLDLADIFKPIIVDRVIFTMINKKMISVNKHFERNGEGVFLNSVGKSLFISELNNKMQQIITIGGRPYTYERVILTEIKKLEAAIEAKEKYKAYKYQM